MKATLNDHLIAESSDIVTNGGYHYFPAEATRLDCLQKAPKTDSDRACPHGVQFYDVVADGNRAPRAAWIYEAPQPRMQEVGGRVGFWHEVKVA
jgi:uncharacterized protein (DUF427 family)